eukprot:COSAG02_NODE_66852_length_254_cov_0.909677_1_plen_64_part_01
MICALSSKNTVELRGRSSRSGICVTTLGWSRLGYGELAGKFRAPRGPPGVRWFSAGVCIEIAVV